MVLSLHPARPLGIPLGAHFRGTRLVLLAIPLVALILAHLAVLQNLPLVLPRLPLGRPRADQAPLRQVLPQAS